MDKQLLDLPARNAAHTCEQLAYVDAYDAVPNCKLAGFAWPASSSRVASL